MDQAATLSNSQLVWSHATETALPPDASAYDYQLACRIADGDMHAFEEFYQRYHRRVYTLCLRMMRNQTEAEDLTQEIFLHVYRKIGSFRGESTMMTWLHRVTVNQVLMHLRKSGVRREKTTEDGVVPEPKVNNAPIPGQMMALDRLVLDKAIAQLPPGYRAVFILHDVEGYEHAEIARMLGGCVGTSKSQLHKARKKLRELLKHDFQLPEQKLSENSSPSSR
ncbi:MAG TPA: RNA polymerase sigma factor [Pyrinomonadaceae bacterium]|jgi:RNA polymerase sigma-70 factor (ECF subfamily)|nr:RNA polymerase sigma factor [Pyrinomonadaceae bacterium]